MNIKFVIYFKSLYGLKQAPKKWYDHFTHYLVTLGYTKGNVNSNIYIKNGDHSIFLIIAFYVDDFKKKINSFSSSQI
jgi:hypothetical protein